MPSFHILMETQTKRFRIGTSAYHVRKGDRNAEAEAKDPGAEYMKIKIWAGLITLVLAAVILRSYCTPQPAALRMAAQPETGRQEARRGGSGDAEAVLKTEGTETEGSEISRREEGSIRVLLKNDDFQDAFHERLEITGTGAFWVQKGGSRTVYEAGEKLKLEPETGQDWNGGKIEVSSAMPDGRLQILNLKRGDAPPAYPGKFEITWQTEGYLVINELGLEEYLPAVLSSEMNASFPAEALKAQAVCARTYAAKRIEEKNSGCFGADLDDSVSYQVYNNKSSDESTQKAVRDTEGLVLWKDGELADTFYYSTSCGATEADSFSEEETLARFLEEGRESDLEFEEPWYRWRTAVSEEEIRQNLTEMGLEAPERIAAVTVLQREETGRARLLEIGGDDRILQISGEYDIRQALAPDQEICLKDGSSSRPLGLLPSAWFVLEPEKEETADQEAESGAAEKTWAVLGGGFGHGNGLSQNGAGRMAGSGADCETILGFYYDNIQIGPWDRRGER